MTYFTLNFMYRVFMSHILPHSRLKGHRVSAKQCPLGLNSMCADFLNAYVLGNVGHTSATLGACATFLYNLNAAVEDIKAGRVRVAIVGSAEAPITPEVIEGFDAMGAEIHGSVSDVFINADGYKRSIASPGPGNYITMAKAVASAVTMAGLDTVQTGSFIQAHGSSTPKNCVSEAEILTVKWLRKRYGEQAFADYQQRNRQVRQQVSTYDTAASRGELNVIYLFGQHALNEDEVRIDMNGITMPGFEQPILYSKTKEYIDF